MGSEMCIRDRIKNDQVVDSIVSTVKIANSAVTAAKADLTAAWAWTGVAPESNVDPSGANSLCRKSYVDSLVNGVHWKESCRIRVASNVDISGPGSTLDGLAMSSGQRVLLVSQTTATENGIYDYNGAASAMTRTSDADAYTELNGAAIFIREGTSADTGYTQTAELTSYAGQVWALFTATAGGRQAGTALSLSSNTLNVDFDNATIGVNGSDALVVKAAGIGTAELGNSVVTNAKLQNSALTVSSGNGLTGGGSISLGGSASLAIQLDGSSLAVGGSGLKIADDGVNSAQIADSACGTAAIADGAITLDKLQNLSAAQILLGNASNRPAAVSVSGDIGISNAGVTAIQTAAVQTGMIADSAVSNAKLASSALSVVAGNGLANGGSVSLGASVSLSVLADGSTMAVSNSGIKVADAGIGATQIGNGVIVADKLASNSVETAKIAANAVTAAKVSDDSLGLVYMIFRPGTESFTGNAATKYDLAQTILAAFHDGVQVYRNGLRCKKSGSASDSSEYSVANNGTGGVTAITFGGAPNGDIIICDYIF